jgi:hypothetical protein
MPAPALSVPDLDALLNEIDRRLHEIQAMLGAGRPSVAAVNVAAGPFADNLAVRRFEKTLAQVPGVTEVTLTGYGAESHAVFDVKLS